MHSGRIKALSLLEDAILQQWDALARLGEFPRMDSDSHWIYGRSRLSAFRSPDEWLAVFEVLVYPPGLGDFTIQVLAYGNKLRRPGVQDPIQNLRAEAAARRGPLVRALRKALGLQLPRATGEAELERRLEGCGLSLPPAAASVGPDGTAIQDDWWCRDPFDLQVRVNGVLRRFKLTPQDYEEAGIDLDAAWTRDPVLDRVTWTLRMLCDALPADELFYPPELLLECLQRPAELPLLLRLEEWCHPGVEGIEKPSDSPCLRALARALAHNDPALYQCSPELVNTHWARWPRWLE